MDFIANTAGIYLFKVISSTWMIDKICSNLTIKTSERRQWLRKLFRTGVFIVDFEQISKSITVFSSLTLIK